MVEGIVRCPDEISTRFQCRNSTTWVLDPGWVVSVNKSFRRATVAYAKSNETVLSYSFSFSPSVPAPVDAKEMLDGFVDASGTFNTLPDILAVLQDPARANRFTLFMYPAMMWECLRGVRRFGAQNPAVAARAADAL